MNNSDFIKSIREPKDNQAIVNNYELADEFKGPVWVYQYRHPKHNWQLSIATKGEPNSKKLSLGGFRIVPTARATSPGYDTDLEAIGLCVGMEEKVFWSKRIKVGGPLGLKNLSRIVGGKCVLLPSSGARIGEPLDQELLDFAITCLKDFELTSGVLLTTGQDLGHGTLSSGKTTSIQYLYDNFLGSISADTSKPTAEGNFNLLLGALNGLGIKPACAQVGLIGLGNIGTHLLQRLLQSGVKVFGMETNTARTKFATNLGVQVFNPSQAADFFDLSIDALVVNANGGSLNQENISRICKNDSIEFVCGSENLALTAEHGLQQLKDARKLYCPTELCGMMGYLTAVEEYLNRCEKRDFNFQDMYDPSKKLAEVGLSATEKALKSNFELSFEDAVREIYN